MKKEAEVRDYSIVLVGVFNPLMFSPDWFKKYNIISDDDYDLITNSNSNNEIIITPAITNIKTEKFSFNANPSRIQIRIEKEPLDNLKTIARSILSQLGGSTISAYGLNMGSHYKINDIHEFQTIADNLTPKKYWAKFLKENTTGDERNGGLLTLKMVNNKEDASGYVILELSRSNLYKTGYYFACNDHTNVDIKTKDAMDVCNEIECKFLDTYNLLKQLSDDIINEACK